MDFRLQSQRRWIGWPVYPHGAPAGFFESVVAIELDGHFIVFSYLKENLFALVLAHMAYSPFGQPSADTPAAVIRMDSDIGNEITAVFPVSQQDERQVANDTAAVHANVAVEWQRGGLRRGMLRDQTAEIGGGLTDVANVIPAFRIDVGRETQLDQIGDLFEIFPQMDRSYGRRVKVQTNHNWYFTPWPQYPCKMILFDMPFSDDYNHHEDKNMPTLFSNIKLIGASDLIENGWLLVEGSRIASFGTGKPAQQLLDASDSTVDCKGGALLPGFIDLHTHGALGTDFLFGSVEQLEEISTFYAAHGVTGYLATTYAANPDEISYALQTLQSFMHFDSGARMLGVHLEGPWLNPSKAGAQNRDTIRTADPQEIISYLDSGLIRLVAVAPEIKENQWLIKACRERGITVAAGHTTATYEEMLDAIRMGVSQVTHCFNAMTPVNHREPGASGAALTRPELACELIADNVHVHPAVMDLLVKAKTPQGVILITDSIALAGMPDTEGFLEGQHITVSGGSARLDDGTLAGSILTMDVALHNLIQATGRPLEELWPCSSLNAARAIGLDGKKGQISPGFDADLVLLDSNLHVNLTMVEGQIRFNGDNKNLISL